MLSFPVHHQLLELAQTQVHQVSDAIQPFHPVIPFSSRYQSFSASRSFPMSQLFISGGKNIGASTLASVLPMHIQYWFPLGLTDLILQSKGLSTVFFNTTVQKYQFFSVRLSLWSNSHIHTWLLEKNITLTRQTFVDKVMPLLFNMLSKCSNNYVRILCTIISQQFFCWTIK